MGRERASAACWGGLHECPRCFLPPRLPLLCCPPCCAQQHLPEFRDLTPVRRTGSQAGKAFFSIAEPRPSRGPSWEPWHREPP